MCIPIEVLFVALTGWLGVVGQKRYDTKLKAAALNTQKFETDHYMMSAPPFVPSATVSPPIVSTSTVTPSFVPPPIISASMVSPPLLPSPFMSLPAYQQPAYFPFELVLMGLGALLLLALTPNLAQYFKVSPKTFNTIGVAPLVEHQTSQDSTTIVDGTLENRREGRLLPTINEKIECIVAKFEASLESINTQLHEKDEALKKLQHNQSEKDETNQYLETEYHKMTEALEHATKESTKKDETITELSAKLDTTEEQRQELVENHENTVRDLKSQLKEAKRNPDPTNSRLRMTMRSLQPQNPRTAARLLERDELNQEVATLREAAATLQTSNENLEQQNSELSEKVKESVKAMNKLQSDHEDLTKNAENISAAKIDLEASRKVLLEEIEGLRKIAEIDRTRHITESETRVKENEELKKKAEKAETKAGLAQTKIASLNTELSRVQESGRTVQSQKIKLHDDLVNTNEKLDEMRKERDEITNQLNGAKEGLTNSRAIEERLTSQLSVLESKVTCAEEDNKKVVKNNQKVVEELAAVKNSLAEANKITLQSQQKLELVVTEKDEEIHRLGKLLNENSQKTGYQTDSDVEIDRLKGELATTQRKAGSDASSLLEARNKITTLQEDQKTGKNRCTEYEHTIATYSNTIETIEKERDAIRTENEALLRTNKELKELLPETEHTRGRSTSVHSTTKVKVPSPSEAAGDAKGNDLQKAYSAEIANKHALKKEIKCLKKTNDELLQKNMKLEEQFRKVNGDQNKSSAQKDDKTNPPVFVQTADKVSKLENELAVATSKARDAEKAYQKLKDRVEEFEQEKCKLEEKLARLEEQSLQPDYDDSEESDSFEESAEHNPLQSGSPNQDIPPQSNVEPQTEVFQQQPKEAPRERVKLQPRSRKAKDVNDAALKKETKLSPEPKHLEDPKPFEDPKPLEDPKSLENPKPLEDSKTLAEATPLPEANLQPKTKPPAKFELVPGHGFDFVLEKAPPTVIPTTLDTKSEGPLLSEDRVRAIFGGLTKAGNGTVTPVSDPMPRPNNQDNDILKEPIGKKEQLKSEEYHGEDVVMEEDNDDKELSPLSSSLSSPTSSSEAFAKEYESMWNENDIVEQNMAEAPGLADSPAPPNQNNFAIGYNLVAGQAIAEGTNLEDQAMAIDPASGESISETELNALYEEGKKFDMLLTPEDHDNFIRSIEAENTEPTEEPPSINQEGQNISNQPKRNGWLLSDEEVNRQMEELRQIPAFLAGPQTSDDDLDADFDDHFTSQEGPGERNIGMATETPSVVADLPGGDMGNCSDEEIETYPELEEFLGTMQDGGIEDTLTPPTFESDDDL